MRASQLLSRISIIDRYKRSPFHSLSDASNPCCRPGTCLDHLSFANDELLLIAISGGGPVRIKWYMLYDKGRVVIVPADMPFVQLPLLAFDPVHRKRIQQLVREYE